MATPDLAYQRCISPRCGARFGIEEVKVACPRCGDLLDVAYDWDRLPLPPGLKSFESKWARRRSAVLQRRVAISRTVAVCATDQIVTVGEGQTILQPAAALASFVHLQPGSLYLQYEGMNPSGSFKDNGMSAAFTHARLIGARRAACASTGNTSASLAMYCAVTRRMKAIIFVGSGKIAYGKLSQALEYGGADRTDRRRFRRCHAAGAGSVARIGHLPGQ